MTILFNNKSEQSGIKSNVSWAYQSIVNISRSDAQPAYVEGYLDLTNMVADDSVNIKENVWINNSFIIFEEKNFSNVQTEPALHFHSKFTPKGIYKLQMNQSYGTSRNYNYHFVILNMTGE